jgi:hypothetical protein
MANPPALDPSFPGLYSDVLWNTALLPAYVVDNLGIRRNKVNSTITSINGMRWNVDNPTSFDEMIAGINTIISSEIYGSLNGGYDCRKNTYGNGTTIPIITANNIPARYVIMGGKPNPEATYQADQLNIISPGVPGVINVNFTYLQTDWRIPPLYLPQ